MLKNSSLFNEFVCKLGFFGMSRSVRFTRDFKGPRVPKRAQFTHERVEYNVLLFDEPLKGSNWQHSKMLYRCHKKKTSP
jgi:hypothetical protein